MSLGREYIADHLYEMTHGDPDSFLIGLYVSSCSTKKKNKIKSITKKENKSNCEKCNKKKNITKNDYQKLISFIKIIISEKKLNNKTKLLEIGKIVSEYERN